jgi:hypothetical protein
MTMAQFIKGNRDELEGAIRRARDFAPRTASCDCHQSGTDHYHDDEGSLTVNELRQWILNDESLYTWARRAGVRI